MFHCRTQIERREGVAFAASPPGAQAGLSCGYAPPLSLRGGELSICLPLEQGVCQLAPTREAQVFSAKIRGPAATRPDHAVVGEVKWRSTTSTRWVGVYTLRSVAEELSGQRRGLVGEGRRKDEIAVLERLLGLCAESFRLFVLIAAFCAQAVVVHAVEIARGA